MTTQQRRGWRGAGLAAVQAWLTALSMTMLLMLLGTVFHAAHAHGSSDAYLHLTRDAEGSTTLRIDVALRDLDRELGIDTNDDREITWGEVRGAWSRIGRHVLDALELRTRDGQCTMNAQGEPALAEHGPAAHVVLLHDVRCPNAALPTQAIYRLFVASDAGHRGLLRVEDAGGVGGKASVLAVLKPSAAGTPLPVPGMTARIAAAGNEDTSAGAGAITNTEAAPRDGGGFLHFMHEGITHIASGADHLLFLVTLIVVTVFSRVDGRWVVRPSRRAIVGDTVRIVTAFTVTHSITLGLAAAGVVAPPSRWVESLIAASVLVAAIDNLKPLARMPRWMLAGIFGWVHGFGFAGPLQELGLSGSELLVPLLAFNLGVEAGQLVVVALLLPLLLMWRHAPRYRSTVVPTLSVAVGLLATVWLVERSFGLDFGLPL